MLYKIRFPSSVTILIWITILVTIIIPFSKCDNSAEVNDDTEMFSEDVKENDFGEGDEFDYGVHSPEATRPHYALDPTRTRRLALMEENLVNALTDLHDNIQISSFKGDLCYKYLSKYLAEYNQDTNATKGRRGVTRANMVTDNPNLTLKMIRRILVTLMNDTMRSCKFQDVLETVEATFDVGGLILPIQDDLDDALLGLLRIQYVYGLNATSQIRLGDFGDGVSTGAVLYFDECLALGKKALEIGADAMAYQWLMSAGLSPPEIESPQEHLNANLLKLETSWQELMNFTWFGNRDEMHAVLRKKKQTKLDGYFGYKGYANCRGEITMPMEYRNGLFCFSQADYLNPYFWISPVKAEILSKDPVIIQFYDFVGDETLNFIRKESAKDMLRSGVVNGRKAKTDFSPVRTSMNSWLYVTEEQNPDEKMVTLNKRVGKLLGLEVHKKDASNMQVVMYGSLGGHYDFHNDALQNSPAKPFKWFGDRIATFLIFLSDTKMGGYTAFPDVGVFAKPVKGSAIVWYSLRLNGEEDDRTVHGGCPVVLGTKEIANLWILQFENFLKHPCSLNSDD